MGASVRAPGAAMAGDLAHGRPCRPRGHVLRPTASTAHARADLRHRHLRAQLTDQRPRGHHGVVPAPVAPAEDIHLPVGQGRQHDGSVPAFLAMNCPSFVAGHDRHRVVVEDQNIIGTNDRKAKPSYACIHNGAPAAGLATGPAIGVEKSRATRLTPRPTRVPGGPSPIAQSPAPPARTPEKAPSASTRTDR